MAILDDRKSLLIAFLDISLQHSFIYLFFSQNGYRRPFWMIKNHFRSHFSPFQINIQFLFFGIFFHKMAAGVHFGWSKITFDRISRHFRSIGNFFFQNGRRRPFLMTENHFRSHFSPFQINTQLFVCWNFISKWPLAAILEVRFGPLWMTENHFRSHFSPFQINI